VRDPRGVGGVDDLFLLLVAVLSFSLFFASFACAYATREAQERGERLGGLADSLLTAVLSDPRWTHGPGLLDRDALGIVSVEALRPLAANHPFEVVIWDLATEERWTFHDGSGGGDWRTSATGANVVGSSVDPARVAATVWGP